MKSLAESDYDSTTAVLVILLLNSNEKALLYSGYNGNVASLITEDRDRDKLSIISGRPAQCKDKNVR